MITYTTGDLLKADVEALVNTVNCEGYMGKGIAYQFKLQYPENNKSYVKACKNGDLVVGKMHSFRERGKLIINFPTKDKWRAQSKMEYISNGLDDLKSLIIHGNIKTIAIPPLGSGNGGLIWDEVKRELQNKLDDLPESIEVLIYEPSINYKSYPIKEPKLSTSALVLMEIKKNLTKFDRLRLQNSAYIMDILSGSSYFKFKRHKYGPYDHSIDMISKNIKEYQKFHSVKSTEEAYKILYNRIISNGVETKMNELRPYIIRSTEIANSIQTNKELECILTVLYLINEQKILNRNEIVKLFKEWSQDKEDRFTLNSIDNAIVSLNHLCLIEENIMGYSIVQ